MSIHPSLRVDAVGTKHRNVFKRAERIKKMLDENKFPAERSIFGLPKLKSIKVKVKKAKEAKEGDEKAVASPAVAAAKADAGKKAAPKK